MELCRISASSCDIMLFMFGSLVVDIVLPKSKFWEFYMILHGEMFQMLSNLCGGFYFAGVCFKSILHGVRLIFEPFRAEIQISEFP